jgi:hypothetical protein
MPFYWFVIGSVLLVLGFTFQITQVTSGLTDWKSSEAAKKFRNVGTVSIIAGLLVIVVSLADMVGNERNAMLTAGSNIVGLGVMTWIQYLLNTKNKKLVEVVAWVCAISGLGLCLLYEFILYHNHV